MVVGSYMTGSSLILVPASGRDSEGISQFTIRVNCEIKTVQSLSYSSLSIFISVSGQQFAMPDFIRRYERVTVFSCRVVEYTDTHEAAVAGDYA